MQNLTEVAKIVEKIRLKPTDLITLNPTKESKSDIFYQKILDGSFKSDRDAAEFFYESDTNNSNYKNLKRFLRRKLLSTLFFIDPKKAHSDYERAYLYCCKNMLAAKVLLFLQARGSGIDLCQKVYSKATQYELTEFIVSSSRYLRLHYGSRMGDLDRFEEYHKVFKKNVKILDKEHLAEEYFARLVMPTIRKRTDRAQIHQQAMEFHKELKGYMEEYDSPYLHLFGHYIHVTTLMSANDYQTSIEVCDEAIKFFEAKPYSYNTPLRVFLHHQLICYTQLKAYEKGKIAAEKSASLIRSGTHSWFTNNELHAILALHARRYEDARKILNKSIGYYKFKSMPSTIQEQWYIYEAYIHFLVLINKLEEDDDSPRRFRLGKFLNSIPTFSKDKRGLNIPILVIQILFMIVKKDYDQAIDRFEAIEKYCSRYLRKDDNFRSNCFIKMLLQIPNANFHKVAVERKTKKYYDSLKTVPLEVANQAYEVEVIPYEDLWEFILEFLGTKFHKPKKMGAKRR